MKEFKFYYGYMPQVIWAENERNAVLKFRHQHPNAFFTIWYALPKEHTFVCVQDYHLTDDNGVLYYECDTKPVY